MEQIRGPFLIAVPLSTIEHWKREFEGSIPLMMLTMGASVWCNCNPLYTSLRFDFKAFGQMHNGSIRTQFYLLTVLIVLPLSLHHYTATLAMVFTLSLLYLFTPSLASLFTPHPLTLILLSLHRVCHGRMESYDRVPVPRYRGWERHARRHQRVRAVLT